MEFSRAIQRRRKNAGYAAISAVGLDADQGVFRIGAAEDVEVLLSRLQLGTWHNLQFVRVIWTPGLAVARTIATGVEETLASEKCHLGKHWYRAPIELLDSLIASEAVKLNARTWTNAELTTRLQRQANQEADRYAKGLY